MKTKGKQFKKFNPFFYYMCSREAGAAGTIRRKRLRQTRLQHKMEIPPSLWSALHMLVTYASP